MASEQQNFQAVLDHQRDIRIKAERHLQWRSPLRLEDPKARFPGFHQRIVQYREGQQVKPGAMKLPASLVMHESTMTALEDGTKLYSDIFLPPRFQSLSENHKDPVPAIIAWGPYGKQGGVTILDDFPMRAGVPKIWLSGLEKWEGPDPAFWCPHEYAIINVDTRGAFTSEGDLIIMGHQEAEDLSEFITWVSGQPWCNGKVGLSGNSWLGLTQWRVGGLRPKGLAALAPWEGFGDYYRDHMLPGGIPYYGFHEDVVKTFTGRGKFEDITKHVRDGNDLWDDYWEDKKSHPERINVPVYAVASWTNPVHTPGTFKAWSSVPDQTAKWLRVHNKQEWSDYYDDMSQRDLLRFFDFYLHSKVENSWDCTPKVRLSVLHLGLTNWPDTVNRAETNFPLARTRYTKYFLGGEGSLSTKPPADAAQVSYDSAAGKTEFWFEIPEACEMTGYFMAHLMMSSQDHDEMDVFVQVEKFSSTRARQGTLCIAPQSGVAKQVLKLIHDWQIGLGTVGMAFHWGPDGQLRASHAPGKDLEKSADAQPYYRYQQKVPLVPGEVRALDIPLRPYGMYWQKGDFLKFTVSGKAVIPIPLPDIAPHSTNNKGRHTIHCGGRGQDSSYLVVPHT
ncbi:Alpha/Beta hydrolase protein [Xylariales sp. AK1849]|nr:Alpha/Beta hydrolase protein [Xylariales sp. AK1849]